MAGVSNFRWTQHPDEAGKLIADYGEGETCTVCCPICCRYIAARPVDKLHILFRHKDTKGAKGCCQGSGLLLRAK